MSNARHFFVAGALAAVALGLGACERQETVSITPGEEAPTVSAEQTSLWRIEVLQDGKATSQVDICADRNVEGSFARPAPELRGKACLRVGDARESGDTYGVRCRIDDQLYQVTSTASGDRASSFTVEMAVTRQDGKGPSFEQVRRYSRVGACPPGWKIGDSAASGAAQVVNTLSGETRTIAGSD